MIDHEDIHEALLVVRRDDRGAGVARQRGAAAIVVAQGPRGGQALRLALPEPGENPPAGVTQYVGTNGAKTAALALVVHRNGAAVGFLCDGKKRWKWFTGKITDGQATLTGAGGPP